MSSVIKKLVVPCNFGDQVSPFAIFIGEPKRDAHPVQHQDNWLLKERGGSILGRVKDSLSSLYKISEENGISFSELCVYAITLASYNEEETGDKR